MTDDNLLPPPGPAAEEPNPSAEQRAGPPSFQRAQSDHGWSSDPPSPLERGLAAAGIAGVSGFIAAWAIRGQLRPGYSAVHDAISRLAADTPGRGWMTAGFVSFGLGVPLFAQALRTTLTGPAWIAATITGIATLGVAAAPLGRHDTAHYLFATIGYVTLAATPLIAAKTLRDKGSARWADWSIAAGAASAILLATSTIDAGHGLTQRLGLGITDLWMMAAGFSIIRSRQTAAAGEPR